MRSANDLRRDLSSVDVRLEREIDYVVNEIGVPQEDALEIAQRRLGRPVPPLHRTRRASLPPMVVTATPAELKQGMAAAQQAVRTLTLGNAQVRVPVAR